MRTDMAATAGADGEGGTGSSLMQAQWSDLPDDLLGMVRLRVASPRYRMRLAAVCRPWRAAAARLPTMPAAPLLLFSAHRHQFSGTKRLCGPDDSWVVRAPHKADNRWFVGSHDGGWVAAVDPNALVIVNFFSGAEVPLAQTPSTVTSYTVYIRPTSLRKVIFSEAPTSSRCILAAIAYTRSHIALCKVGRHHSGWTTRMQEKMVGDISFCNGELYALIGRDEELVKFEIGMKEDGTPFITSSHQMAIQKRHGPTDEDDPMSCTNYIMELHGKLAMAIGTRWLPNREPFLKIFRLVNADNLPAYKYKWEEVTTFGDYAVFVGWMRSIAVHVTVDRCCGLERNHIYYCKHITSSDKQEPPHDAVYSVTLDNAGHMYCMDDQSVGDSVERTGYYMTGGNNAIMWLHPPEGQPLY